MIIKGAPSEATRAGESSDSDPELPVSQMLDLSRVECLRLLAAHSFGRLAVALTDGAPVIRPVNYVFDESSQSIVLRTSHGSKLHAVLQVREAAFEIDGVDEDSRTGWSVIVHGRAEEVTNHAEVRRLGALGVTPWAPGRKGHWVRIRARTVTGRRIEHLLPAGADPQA
jgi:nitroimidazol reductase NimA-like FMN-containing flavoprotein (pyridoxamine 5'-phosphate oxidase superfamily)